MIDMVPEQAGGTGKRLSITLQGGGLLTTCGKTTK